MSGSAKLLTAGGGGVSLTPASSIASDVTVNVPVTGVSGGTLVCSDSSGNVGIGTSSPANKLHIESSEAIIRLKDTDATGYTLISANNTRAGLYFQADPSNDSADSDIRFSVDNTERMRIDSSGNLLFNSGYGSVATAYGCRAWVNFNGTSTVAIRASGNVTSITDNGTGDYTVNFTNAMPDGNYSTVGSAGNGNNAGSAVIVENTTAATASAVQIVTTNAAFALTDRVYVNVAVFR